MNITFLTVLQWPVYFISLYFSIFWLLVYLEETPEEQPKKRRRKPDVTIAIPAYNEENTIEKTIESALNIDYPTNKLQILVVNDGSTDATKQKAHKYTKHKHVTLINQKNQGKGAALNHAVRKATGEFFVCLDADSEVEPDALMYLLEHFEDPTVAAALPVMKIKNDKKLNLLSKLQWYEYLVNVFFKKVMAKIDCVHVAPGPFSVYRTQIIKDVGYFAEDNLTEDLEMTVRLQKENYRVVQDMNGVVYTNAMPTLKRYLNQRNRWFKGGLFNAMDYREMLFNKKWGDFGVMQLPILILSGVISLLLVGTLLWELIKPIFESLFRMSLVSFDFMTFLRTITFDFKFVDLSAGNIILLITMFTISVVLLRLATYYTNEKIFTYNPLIVITYVIFYFFLLALTWAVVVKDLITGRVQKW